MKISLHSDIHTEFHNGKMPTVSKDADVIILAGDIIVGEVRTMYLEQFCENYSDKQVIWVAGNHEYYGNDYDALLPKFREFAEGVHNLHFLENDSVELDGIVFHGCTLWTDFTSKGEEWRTIGMLEAARNIGDFHTVRRGHLRLTPTDISTFHLESLEWLSRSLKTHSKSRNVVITHFPPLIECRHPRIPDNILSTYFNNDLVDLVGDNNIELWCYGHNHWSDDFKVMDTRFCSNQKGYPSEKTSYGQGLLIEL